MKDLSSKRIVFIDIEADPGGKTVLDIGAIKGDGSTFHSGSAAGFPDFLRGSKYICGHNILKHDVKYIEKEIAACGAERFVDTLYLSPLLYPKKPYHKLVKDDKLVSDEFSNPLNDAKKARDLLHDEIGAFENLNTHMRQIYPALLRGKPEFMHFFELAGIKETSLEVCDLIRSAYEGRICTNAPIEKLAQKYPIELAYALALIGVIEYDCITPPWVLMNYPRTENVISFLRSRKCRSCAYCNDALDEGKALKRFFHYDSFRSYDGVPLQQSAVKAAVGGKSILAIFPTGGGKSITFQLPALMAGVSERGLTVVIWSLQSLMKDQISRNITPQKFKQLFGELSPAQVKVINGQKSDYIVV